ncbi:MAG: hypothetical protein CMJ46_16485 [Planctomyces sp.]|nr:hypothetical protein [Planctomyces sp.]
MKEGWSTKQLIRRLVLSEAFRQSGDPPEAALDVDPANRLLHHYGTRRLEAEAIRDSMLLISGRLDPALFGPAINPYRTAEDTQKRLFSGPLDGHGRRSIYLEMSIMEPPKFLVGFNLPDLKIPTGKRDVTNVPGQALILLNDPFVNAMAETWATSLQSDQAETVEERIHSMFLQAYGRVPTGDDLNRWSAAARSFSKNPGEIMTDTAAWTEIGHALFNTKEFLYYR